MKFESSENLDMAKDSTETSKNNEDKPGNNYDQEVSENEIENLQKEIEEKIEIKAEELEIPKERLIELAGLDLESLEAEKLKELNLRQGELDFIRSDIDAAINEFQKSDKPNTVLKDAPSSIDKIRKFTGEHKKAISVGQLALYLSSYGMPVLNALADNDAKVEIEGEKISLKDLAENPELMKKIDQARSLNSPIDVLKAYSPLENFEHNENEFSFGVAAKIDDDSNVKKFVFFQDIGGNSHESIEKLDNDLKKIGVSLLDSKGEGKSFLLNINNAKEGCLLDDFLKNKGQIAKIIAQDFNVPESMVEEYIESFIMPDISKISVVELGDFNVDKDLEIPEDALKLQQKRNEIYEKHNVYSEDWAGKNPENWLKAEEELKQWGEENGYENIEKAIQEEKENYENLPIVKLENLKAQEKEIAGEKNADKFKDIFLKELNESGYSIEKLKEIAEKNPEKVIEIISEVIGENVSYSKGEYLNIKYNNFIEELMGDGLLGDLFKIDMFQDSKHSKGIPYITMESNKGVCHDYGMTLVAVKYLLEQEGVPNLDKYASIWTISNEQCHLWNGFATVDSEGNVAVSYAEPTWADSPEGELNAVDEKHYYASLPEKLDEAHQEALEKIENWNNLVKQEKLKEILMQYNLKQDKRDHMIEGNEKLRETEKDVEVLQEERTKNVKESLKKIRERIGKINRKKDS